MAHTLDCQHCGSPVVFEDDERGFEVYCRSCGRANPVPTASEEPRETDRPLPGGESWRRAASIFAETSAPGDTLVGQQTCLCGEAVPVRLEDLGESVYCPSCGTEMLVGQTLLRRERGARLAAGRLEEKNPNGAVLPKRRCRFLPYSVAAVMLAAVIGAGVWLSGTSHTPVELLGRWADSLGISVGPGKAALAETAAEKGPRPSRRPEITLPMIEALAQQPDPAAALVQARTWQKLLEKQGVTAEDPRRVKLAALTADLEARLAPPVEKPPACLAEFQRHVEALASALKSREFQAAGQSAQIAEELLRRHPRQLAGHDRRFQMLKERLEREQEMGSDAVKIRTLLERAQKLAAAGKATEALESQAEARFLAIVSALTPGEAAQLDELDRRVEPEIRYARGRRAVDAALKFAAQGDKVSRDQEAHSALDILSGLPEARIRPLIARVVPFVSQTRTGGAPVQNQTPQEEIRRRRAYETALEGFGRGQLVALAAACRELEAIGGGESPHDLAARCRQRLVRVLNWQIDQAAKNLHDASGKAVAASLADARELLDTSDFWRKQPVYEELNRAIQQFQGQQQTDGSPGAKGAEKP